MKKVSLSGCKNISEKNSFIMKPFFGAEDKASKNVNMGYALLKPGTRIPDTGEASHDGDEYAYIMKGAVKVCVNGETQTFTAGDASYIPTGEGHYSYNDGNEDCELVYMLVKTGSQ